MQMEVRSSGVDRTLHCVDPDTSGLCTADYRTGGIEVRLDFHNTAAVAQPVNLSGLQLETSDGQLHGNSPIAQVAGSSGGTHDCNPSTDGSIPSLAPGGVLSNIRVCFAVPPRQSAGPLQLRYQEQDPAPTGTLALS